MKLSKFANRFIKGAGIVELMDDLGEAMAGNNDTLMLGGGNPAHIPQVQRYFKKRWQAIADNNAEFAHVIGNYDPPTGEKQFRIALAELLKQQYGWDIDETNVAITAGSQSAFFLLFNMFAGDFLDGTHKKVLLPLAPEYIGYDDVGLSDNLFVANKPKIEKYDDRFFKYHIDFDALQLSDEIGAICVSRPTNPTGNVLSDAEVQRLHSMAKEQGIPLIIDNAYGAPFPNIIFTPANLIWDEHIILCMSLSKIGLPGTRTGIVIARQEVIAAISQMNAILNLSMGSFGPALALDLVRSKEIINLSNQVVKPYYAQKAKRAIQQIKQALDGVDYYLHKAEGALFLWLWLPGLPISSKTLYERLKQRGVLVLSGHYFFPGLSEQWQHKDECIRITYSMDDDVVAEGIKIIADEIKALSAK